MLHWQYERCGKTSSLLYILVVVPSAEIFLNIFFNEFKSKVLWLLLEVLWLLLEVLWLLLEVLWLLLEVLWLLLEVLWLLLEVLCYKSSIFFH